MNRILLASALAFVAAIWASAHVEAGLQTRQEQPTDVVGGVLRA